MSNKSFLLFLLLSLPGLSSYAGNNRCSKLFSKTQLSQDFKDSLTKDFEYRDSLPETPASYSEWKPSWGKWGPWPTRFPKPIVSEKFDLIIWARHRIEAVGRKYIGLPYKHRHIPSLGGLDCSNFTAWVYNYGLGIQLKSNIEKQSLEAGRRLNKDEVFKKGDLLFSWNNSKSRISHVVIYLGKNKVIDSAQGGIQVRDWKKRNFAWARRIIE